MEDRLVVSRIKGGEVEAYAILVEKYHGSLLNYIYRMVRDEKIVEDIGQEVFLDVYRSLAGFDEERGTPFSSWLFTVAHNRCVSELRRRSADATIAIGEIEDLAAGEYSAEALLIEREKRRAFRACLKALSEPFRRVLLMNLDGSSLEEIARTCGISAGTAKSRVHRAREKMRLLIKGYPGERGYEKI